MIDSLHADQSKGSFWAYRQYINPKLKKAWWPREVAKELQSFWEKYLLGERPKLVIMAPPQHGKSTAVIDFLSWIAGKSSNERVIYASFSERLGVRANLQVRRAINSEKYQNVFPDTKIGAKCTQDYFEYADSEGYFRNTTVRGSVTGESLDIGVIDDPIKGRIEANSETVRNTSWEWFTDDFSTRFSDHGALLIILTRWHIDDPVGRLLAIDPAVKILKYPAIAIKDEANRKKGEPLFPAHKSLEFLRSIEARMHVSSWESLYQQSPIVSDGEIFKPDSMLIIDALSVNCRQFVRAWDLGATSKGDYTVGVKMTRLDDQWIICDVARMRGLPNDVRDFILNTAKRDGKKCIVRLPQDPGQAGKAQISSFTSMLAGFSVKADPVTGSKEVRSEAFAAQANVGNVSLLRGNWNDSFIDELRSFPNGKYDDQVDAGADAFNSLTDKKEIDYMSSGETRDYGQGGGAW
jgi:predicted phage terminase large subunit-like protein